MDIEIQGSRQPTTLENGRFTKTFIPRDVSEIIKIFRKDCIGTTKISEIQIEKGNVASDYVEPSSRKDEISGLYKDLRAINIQMQDPSSEFWSKITANNKAMITEFGDGVMTSAIGQTADVINSRIESLKGEVSSVTQLAQGIQSLVSGKNGVESRIEQLANQITSKVSSEDIDTIIGQSEEAIWFSIKDKVSKVASESKMNGDEIKTAINLSKDGIKLDGSQVSITGDTYIQKGIINEAHIKNGVVSKLFADEVKANSVVAKSVAAEIGRFVNIDANSITSGKLSADRIGAGIISGRNGEWNLNTGIFRTGSLTRDNIRLLDGVLESYVGSKLFSRLTGRGIEIFHEGQSAGHIGTSYWYSTRKNNFRLGHAVNTSMTLSYSESNGDAYYSYIIFDKYNSTGKNTVPIEILEDSKFNKSAWFTEFARFTQKGNIVIREAGITDPSGRRQESIIIGHPTESWGILLTVNGEIYTSSHDNPGWARRFKTD